MIRRKEKSASRAGGARYAPLSVLDFCIRAIPHLGACSQAISELETFACNLGDLWQVSAWLLHNETTKLGKLTNFLCDLSGDGVNFFI